MGIPQWRVCEPRIGHGPEPRVESRVKEKLQGKVWAMLIACTLSDGCRQATSGTDPPYRNAPDVYTKARPFAGKPTKSAVTIIKSRRERVLRSKAVVGADDHAIDPGAKCTQRSSSLSSVPST